MSVQHDWSIYPAARRRSLFTTCIRRSLPLLAGVAALFLSSQVVVAGGIPCADDPDALCYGDFDGSTVMYLNVREKATTADDDEPLFGMPTISGDSLDFDPLGFDANAAGGSSDITDSNLSFRVMAHPQKIIKNLTLSEAGDTTLLGLPPKTAYTSVSANIFVDVFEIDGNPVALPGFNLPMMFTPSDGDFDLVADGAGSVRYHTNWSGSLLIDIMDYLDSEVAMGHIAPFVGGATKISINLDNTLSALSEDGTSAVIAKKDAGGISITVNIPEPSCMVLVGLCVAALSLVRRGDR